MKHYLQLDLLTEDGYEHISDLLDGIARGLRRGEYFEKGSGAGYEYWCRIAEIPRPFDPPTK